MATSKDGSAKTQVTTFAAGTGGAIEAVEFDHELPDVRRLDQQSPGAEVFEINAKITPSVPVETKIKFATGGKHARELSVRVDPSPVEN